MVHVFVFKTNKKCDKFSLYSKNKYVDPCSYMSTGINIEQKHVVQSMHDNKQYISIYIYIYICLQHIHTTIFTIKHLDELKQEQNQVTKKRNHRN